MKGLENAAQFLKENDDFVIVSHRDADGVTAAAIIALTLQRLGKQFKVHSTKSLDNTRIAELSKLGNVFVFTDIGSGVVERLEQALKDRKFCIIDHHRPNTEYSDKIAHFNPHFSGHDGASEVSGASAAYLVAKQVSIENKDLGALAIVGSVGDMQDSTGALIGLNRTVLKDSEEAGVIETKKDIRLFGRHSRSLIPFLSYCSNPYLPGLTANEAACQEFLIRNSIPLKTKEQWNCYVDLSAGDRKRLISALYIYGLENGVSENSLRNLVGEVYELVKEQKKTELKDAKEFSTLLNACARHEQAEIGIKVCMGDRDKYFKKAHSLLQSHRKMLHDAILWAQENKPQELPHMHVMDAKGQIKDTLIGVVAGMLYGAGSISPEKPIISMTEDEEGMLKISARANWDLVNKGLDLGVALKEVTDIVGGEGGGHSIASGARIDPLKKQEFLKILDEIIGKQLKK